MKIGDKVKLKRSKSAGLIVAGGLLTSAATIGLAIRASDQPASVAPAVTNQPAAISAIIPSASRAVQGQRKPERIETETITILPHKIDPEEISRPPGLFVLSVDNRSGLEEVILRLDAPAGARLREVAVHQDQLDWNDVLNLAPGVYLLTEANHPDWVCRIKIGDQ